MEKAKVVVLYCNTYEENKVYETLKKGLDLLGGPEAFFSPEEKILLKLNLLRIAAPEKAITVHPAVAAAFARILYEAGCRKMTAGDSGFGSALKAMKELGLEAPFEKWGVRMAEFREGKKTAHPEGVHAKEFFLAKEVLETDALVSLAKMKTHALEYITAAVKNQYGCVQGISKGIGHTTYPSQESFARMLVDLNLCVKPRLYVLDGIVAMEGNGPASGTPTPMNVLMLSEDPVAIDSIFCRMVGLDPETVPTNVHGERMGLGTWHTENIQILTEDGEASMEEIVEKYGNPGFDVIRTKHTSKGIMGALTNLRRFKRRPRLHPERCKKCGICVEACPVEGKAIRFANGRQNPPVYDYKKCIRCFCCQEMCPHQAIDVKGR